jgi:hypothetical protein
LAQVAVAGFQGGQIQLVHQVVDQVGRMALVHEVVQAGRQQEGLVLIVGAVHPSLRRLVCHQDTILSIPNQRIPRPSNELRPALRSDRLIAQAASARQALGVGAPAHEKRGRNPGLYY